MDKYTIYCSDEQTKKAIEFGAPIETKRVIQGYEVDIPSHPKHPTAEQMIGWLDEIGQTIEVCRLDEGTTDWYINVNDVQVSADCYPSRKEAVLAAIDFALNFLGKYKK